MLEDEQREVAAQVAALAGLIPKRTVLASDRETIDLSAMSDAWSE